jgi:hypothetical protein
MTEIDHRLDDLGRLLAVGNVAKEALVELEAVKLEMLELA